MPCLTKENHSTRPTHDSRIGIIPLTISILGATHKGTTSLTLGRWLDSLPDHTCLWGNFPDIGPANKQCQRSKTTTRKTQVRPHSDDLHGVVSQTGRKWFTGTYGHTTNATSVPQMV